MSRTKQGKEDFWIRVHIATHITEIIWVEAFTLQLIQHKLKHLVLIQMLDALSEEFKLTSDKLRHHCLNEGALVEEIAEDPPLLCSVPIHSHYFQC